MKLIMTQLSTYPRFKEFLGKNILCIDYGTKVTGTAYFCPGREPFPLMHDKIIYKNDQELIKSLLHIIEEDFIDLIVLGTPYLLDGTETKMTIKIKEFGNKLQEASPELKLYHQDETLSTQAAKDRMTSSAQFDFKIDLKKIDQLAAVIILEDFIKN